MPRPRTRGIEEESPGIFFFSITTPELVPAWKERSDQMAIKDILVFDHRYSSILQWIRLLLECTQMQKRYFGCMGLLFRIGLEQDHLATQIHQAFRRTSE